MRKRGETYVYKAVVNLGSWPPRRYWHTKLPLREGKAKPPTADEIVKPLWSLLVADGIDPVEIGARDALEQLRLEAANTPDGPLACWCRLALAADVRAFRHEWNARRATEARYRLTRDMET